MLKDFILLYLVMHKHDAFIEDGEVYVADPRPVIREEGIMTEYEKVLIKNLTQAVQFVTERA